MDEIIYQVIYDPNEIIEVGHKNCFQGDHSKCDYNFRIIYNHNRELEKYLVENSIEYVHGGLWIGIFGIFNIDG